MASLNADDLTVVLTDQLIMGNRQINMGTVAIAATDTYPNGGIPVGTAQKWGFRRQLDNIMILGSAGNTTEYLYGYDSTNRKLQIFIEEDTTAVGGPPAESGTSEVPGARTVRFKAVGW